MEKHQSLTLCGETLATPLHVCAFFDSSEERYEVILPYIREGLQRNDEVLNILECSTHHDHCARLTSAGIPVDESLFTGQLKVLATEDAYLNGGSFAADKMYSLLEDALVAAKRAGYDRIRACGDMEWALRSIPGTDELIEYEARLNLLTPHHSCSLVCMYDIHKFSGPVIADIMATHPYVILNGKIHKNPHYIEPFDFLPTLLRRKKRPLQSEL